MEAETPPAPKGRGRPAGFSMSNAHRDKIRKSNILRVLIDHVEGKREMSATQVSAGLGLLRKCLPDLSTVTLQGDEGGGPVLHQIELVGVRPSGDGAA